MKITARVATKKDMPALRSIWQECFHLDGSYLDLVEKSLFPYSDIYILAEETKDSKNDCITYSILSTFTLIPIDYFTNGNVENTPESSYHFFGAYLGGVATPVKNRGHNYFYLLFYEVCQMLGTKNAGKNITSPSFILTRPAEQSLIKLYINAGFTVGINNPCCNGYFFKEPDKNSGIISGTEIITAKQIRKKIIVEKKPCLVWNEKILDYVLEEKKSNPVTEMQFNFFLSDIKASESVQYAFIKILDKNLLKPEDFYKAFFIFTLE